MTNDTFAASSRACALVSDMSAIRLVVQTAVQDVFTWTSTLSRHRRLEEPQSPGQFWIFFPSLVATLNAMKRHGNLVQFALFLDRRECGACAPACFDHVLLTTLRLIPDIHTAYSDQFARLCSQNGTPQLPTRANAYYTFANSLLQPLLRHASCCWKHQDGLSLDTTSSVNTA